MGVLRPKKNLLIDIDYNSLDELQSVLEQVKKQIKTGLASYEGVVCDCKYRYDVIYSFMNGRNYRYETINGNDCIVVSSNLHKNY
jgi:hypothetical protein